MSRLLVEFAGNRENKPDFAEKVGDFGLLFLRAGFGKMVTVESKNGGTEFSEINFSTALKVFTIFAFFLTLPISGLLAAIGAVATACSTSHKNIYKFYISPPDLYGKFMNQIFRVADKMHNRMNSPFSSKNINHSEPLNSGRKRSSEKENTEQSSKQQKRVGFGPVRARDFEKAKPAKDVAALPSVEIRNVHFGDVRAKDFEKAKSAKDVDKVNSVKLRKL